MIKRDIITLIFVILGFTSALAQNSVSDTSSNSEVSDTDVVEGDSEESDNEATQLAKELNDIEVKSVTNIRASMNSINFLDIMYDLSENSDIEIYFSWNDGASFVGPLKNVSGDVGEGIEAGQDKLVSWDIRGEMGEIKVTGARIKIIAKKSKLKPQVDWTNTFLFGTTFYLSGSDGIENPTTPLSIMYGGYRRAGIYTRFEMAIGSPSYEDTWDLDRIFYDGTGSESRMAASFGLLFRLGNFGALGFGASGGIRSLYANTVSGGTVKYADDLFIGGEASFIANIKFISLGVTGVYYDGMPACNVAVGVNF